MSLFFANPNAQYKKRSAAILAAVEAVFESNSYILGPRVDGFEKAYAAYLGTSSVIGLANGTDAIILALKAAEIGPGDEVITTPLTAIATIAAIVAAGATPVLADIDPLSYTLAPRSVETVITAKTRAIVAVHIYGQTADLDALGALAKTHNLTLIEDCAQAAGARYRGRLAGSIGDAGTFSFFPTKNLGGIGDGGAVSTSNPEFALKIRRLRQYGWNDTRECVMIGGNSRLDEVQAAILSVKLPDLDADNAARRALAAVYDAGLRDLPVQIPFVAEGCEHAYHLYTVLTDRREELMAHLRANGITPGIHYLRPAHRDGAFAELVVTPKAGLPVAERVCNTTITLPIYPELSLDDAGRVVAAMRSFFENARN